MIMKIYAFLILFFLQLNLLTAQTTEVDNLTPEGVWNLVIKHYDPVDNWSIVEGSLHMNSISPTGELISEDVVLNNEFDIYQNFLFKKDTVIMRKKGPRASSFSVNGKDKLSQKKRTQLKLMPNDIDFIKRRHLFEIGLPMYLKIANIQFTNEVKEGNFNNTACLVLESVGTGQATKAAYPFIQQPIFYYVNPSNYSLLGMEFPTEIKEQDIPGYRIIFNEEIIMNGIKIPQVKKYYNYKTGEYLYTTIFHTVTRKDHANDYAAQQMIQELIQRESRYFGMRNYTKWAECWSMQEDVYQSYVAKDGYAINEGWTEVSEYAKDFFSANPDPHFTTIEPSNFTYHIHGNIAWVYFDSPVGSLKQGRHQRIARKENGVWKVISWTGFDEFSYRAH